MIMEGSSERMHPLGQWRQFLEFVTIVQGQFHQRFWNRLVKLNLQLFYLVSEIRNLCGVNNRGMFPEKVASGVIGQGHRGVARITSNDLQEKFLRNFIATFHP